MKKTFFSLIIIFSINSHAISHVEHYAEFNYLEYELFRNNKSIGYHKYDFVRENDALSIKSEVNFKITKLLALELSKLFLEVIIANKFETKALKILKKKKNLRLIDASNYSINEGLKYMSSNNEILIQSEDLKKFTTKDFKIVSKRKPSTKEMKNLIFAFNICKYVKSNAIVIAANETTTGIGSGQSSRLDSCKIAIEKMKKFVNTNENLVAASDAFFPFVDGIEKLVQSGVQAVIQPSGSIRDKEIINFANETDTILVFSKTRHFKH